MNIKIEHHRNYGKDLITLQEEAMFSFTEKMQMSIAVIKMISRISQKIGIIKTLKLFSDVKERVNQVLELDAIRDIHENGVSMRNLSEMIERIALGETMVRYLGSENAIKIRTNLSEEIASVFFPKLFPTYPELREIEGGYIPNLMKFLDCYATQNTQKHLQVGSITDETEDGFKLIITECNFAKVSAIMGDPEICYWTTCITDGYYFPIQAKEAGIVFKRNGTIATGQKVCDFCWSKRSA